MLRSSERASVSEEDITYIFRVKSKPSKKTAKAYSKLSVLSTYIIQWNGLRREH
jgi:hypothetical protein